MADEPDDPPDVLAFRDDDPRARPAPIAEVKRRSWDNPNVCEHKRGVVVDMTVRTIECKLCGAHLDPFAYILIISERWNEVNYRYEAIREHKRRERERAEREQQRREARRKKPG